MPSNTVLKRIKQVILFKYSLTDFLSNIFISLILLNHHVQKPILL